MIARKNWPHHRPIRDDHVSPRPCFQGDKLELALMAVRHNRKLRAIRGESPTGPLVEPGDLLRSAFLRIKSDEGAGVRDHLVVNTNRCRRPRARETVDAEVLEDRPWDASGEG
jgi:hypothetical protein